MGREKHHQKCHRPMSQCICGRPEAITPEVEKSLEEYLKIDLPVYKAVKYAGITEQTFYNHAKKYPKFLEKMKRAKYYATHLARISVIKVFPTNPEIALRYLSLKESDEFNTKSTQSNESTVTINLTDEAKKRLGKYVDNPTTPNADDKSKDYLRDLDGRFASGAPKGKKMLDL